MRVLTCIFMAGALAASSSSWGQSLAEVAEKEKARRKQQGGSAKVLTEADIAKSGKGTFSAPEGQAAEAEAKPGEEGKAGEPGEAKPGEAGQAKAATDGAAAEKAEEKPKPDQQATWREKVKQTQEAISKLKESIARFEATLGDTAQNLYGGTRQKAGTQLEAARASLVQAEGMLADLQEEARRNNWR